MADEGFKRKLAAILSADVEGYSRLMDDDEEATVRTLTSYRSAITDLVQQYRGRVVDSPGDNILAEFASVVDSVNCAVEIQRDLAERNEELPDNRKMRFRIGVNLGDVIDEDGRIYGDGVNIAARVESLAEAGGICISGRAHTQVENKLGLEYEDLGKHEVKNISRPIQVYRVLSYPGAAAHRVVQAKKTLGRKWQKIAISTAVVVVIAIGLGIWQFYMRRPTIEPASLEKMAYPLPDKPSIAVLAFDNLSGDPAQEYFSDGISEDIITALSKIPKMFVIARNSSFTYKGKPVKVQQVAEELGVRYVLEGSVRKVGEKVRINAQLIDAQTGRHLWAEKYDRELKDILALQDEVTKSIITELQVKLTDGEQARIRAKGTNNLDAYLKILEARNIIRTHNIENNRKARNLFEEAIEIDPNYAAAYRWLSASHYLDVLLGVSNSPGDSIKSAIELSKKALSIDDSLGDAHGFLGILYVWTKQYEKGMPELEKAAELYPNAADLQMYLASGLLYTDEIDKAILVQQKAIRLNPMAPSAYFNNLSAMYRSKGDFKEALVWAERAVKQEPEYFIGNVHLCSVYYLLGREEEANLQAKKVLKLNPNFSLKKLERTLPYKNPEVKKQYIDALRSAGLPYEPPLPLPDKPSIAVLPFKNMSGDPEQQYLCDGITEQIITSISKVPYIFVIARQSSFSFRDKQLTVQQIARELGVRYILEGSLQRSGERIRINVQLIDATSGHHIWAENYDRKLDDIFAVQDDICKNIMVAMRVKLTLGEMARINADTVTNIRAYEKYLKGFEYYWRRTKEDSIIAQQLFQEAISLDPGHDTSYILLGWTHLDEVWFRITDKPSESIAKAEEMVQKAIAIRGMTAPANSLLSMIYIEKRDIDKAIAHGENAVKQTPSSATPHFILGIALRYNGQYEESISSIKKAIRLNPLSPIVYLNNLAWAYLGSQQYEKAISTWKEAVERNPDYLFAHMGLTAAHWLNGSEAEARQSAKQVLRIYPEFTVGYGRKIVFYKVEADQERIHGAMRKVGLPE